MEVSERPTLCFLLWTWVLLTVPKVTQCLPSHPASESPVVLDFLVGSKGNKQPATLFSWRKVFVAPFSVTRAEEEVVGIPEFLIPPPRSEG